MAEGSDRGDLVSDREVDIADLARRVIALERGRVHATQDKRNTERFRLASTTFLVVALIVLLIFSVFMSPPGQVWLDNLLSGGAGGARLGTQSPGGTGTVAQVGASQISYTDFITLFLAISAGGIAYMASMMGMRRLEPTTSSSRTFAMTGRVSRSGSGSM